MMWLVALVGSNVIDLIIAKEVLSKTNARKVANTLATMGPAMALFGKTGIEVILSCKPTARCRLLRLRQDPGRDSARAGRGNQR